MKDNVRSSRVFYIFHDGGGTVVIFFSSESFVRKTRVMSYDRKTFGNLNAHVNRQNGMAS